MSEPVLIHIPHSALYIPPQERSELLLDETELFKEQLLITDRYTDELFAFPGAVLHIRSRFTAKDCCPAIGPIGAA